jgi:hypothetical protein
MSTSYPVNTAQKAGIVLLLLAALWGGCPGSIKPPPTISGEWDGRFVTEAVNAGLQMSIQRSSTGSHTGTWKFIGADGQVLNRGTLTATISVSDVTILLRNGSPTRLEGRLSDHRISGTVNDNSGTFNVSRR